MQKELLRHYEEGMNYTRGPGDKEKGQTGEKFRR